ncbi:ADP-ribose diphosphatase [Volucribacter amazonae]|uniref:ADP-ribose pyrophosphatase n=1 Tax=Volucribacter amazonae TaxID=256731 RepID=A0A9X4SL31_9PAST|nr:ADP-ribose diphosphatase [Volucribacter amazonae]MDG6895724.1 ADP-ribose pyrophosphatase [Volucribacter amazonae]
MKTQFSQQDIEIVKQDIVYQGFFTLQKIQFRHKLFNGGTSDIVTRELLTKGQAVVVIAYDPQLDAVVMVEQVRIGAYVPNGSGSPWLLEMIAGMLEQGESPEQVARREAKEEAGIALQCLDYLFSVWDSPGGVSERIHFFVAKVDAHQAKGIHGLATEQEDIRVQVLDRTLAYQAIASGDIDNSLAVIGLQWLQLNYADLQHKWLYSHSTLK